MEENWRVQTSNNFQFSAQYTAIHSWEEISIQHTWGQRVWKIENCTRCKVQVTGSRVWQRKQGASHLNVWRKGIRCPFLSGRIRRLQSSCTSKTFGGFYPLTLVSKHEETKAISYAGETFSLNSRILAKKSWFWLAKQGRCQAQEHQSFMSPVRSDAHSVSTRNSVVIGQCSWIHQNHLLTWGSCIIDAQMVMFGMWRHPLVKMKSQNFYLLLNACLQQNLYFNLYFKAPRFRCSGELWEFAILQVN